MCACLHNKLGDLWRWKVVVVFFVCIIDVLLKYIKY